MGDEKLRVLALSFGTGCFSASQTRLNNNFIQYFVNFYFNTTFRTRWSQFGGSFFTIFALSFFLISCGGPPEDGRFGGDGNKKKQAQSVEVTTVERGTISDQILTFGTIRSQEFISVTPQISQRITRFYVDLGDTVRRGQPLAKLFDDVYQNQVESNRSQIEQAKVVFSRDSSNYARQVQLRKRDLVSATEVENAYATFQSSKAQLSSARASFTQAQDNLRNTTVRSPVNGVVVNRNLEEGDIAPTGQPLLEVSGFIGLETRVNLPIQDWERVEIGQPVTFALSNAPNIKGEGVVSRISPRLNEMTGLGEVVINITDGKLNRYLGALTRVGIDVVTRSQTLTIPRSAMVENVQTRIDPESNSIELSRSYSTFLVQDDTLALRRELTLGVTQGNRVEILEGLNEGDEIVITGQSGLADSAFVNVASTSFLTEPDSLTIIDERSEEESSSSEKPVEN